MGLNRVRLGDCLSLIEHPNVDQTYGIDDVRGVNNQKLMIRTKADVSSRDFTKFQVVRPGQFFFNHRTSRNGSKFSITYNYDDAAHIVTEDYVVFCVSDEERLCPEWLYLYVCRSEYDRYVIQNSWGSSTEFFNWEDLCDTEIDLPPIEIQRKYVAIYEAMLANQRAYESGLDDLKLTCDALIEKLMCELPHVSIGPYIEQSDSRNDEDEFGAEDVRGLSISKQLIETKANLDGVSLNNYKLVEPRALTYVPVTSRNGDKISIALNETDSTFITSAINTVFRIKKSTERKLLPDYLMLFFGRTEFDRYARFNSWGSARETFDWADMCDVRIPLPSFAVQRYAVDLYKAWRTRLAINDRLKAQLKEICSVLIRGSIEEALE